MRKLQKFLDKAGIEYSDTATEQELMALAVANGYVVNSVAKGEPLDTSIEPKKKMGFEIPIGFKGLEPYGDAPATGVKDPSQQYFTLHVIQSDGKEFTAFRESTANARAILNEAGLDITGDGYFPKCKITGAKGKSWSVDK